MERKWRRLQVSHLDYEKIMKLKENGNVPSGIRCIGNKILVTSQIYNELMAWKEEKVDVNIYLNSFQIGTRLKKNVLRKLSQQGMLLDGWQAIAVGGKLVEKEALDSLNAIIDEVKLGDKELYLSEVQAQKKYGIKINNLQNAYIAERIQKHGDKFLKKDLEILLAHDKQLVSIKEVFLNYEKKYGVKMGNKVKEMVREEIIRTNLWDKKLYFSNYLLRKDVSIKEEIFCNVTEDIYELIDSCVVTWAVFLSTKNFGYMWSHLAPNVTKIICDYFEVEKNKENLHMQPKLHKIMAVFLRYKKDVNLWLQSDIEEFQKMNIPKDVKVKCCKILSIAKRQFGNEMECQPDVVRFPEKKNREKINEAIIPYSYKQFIALAALLFSEDIIFENGIIQRAIESVGSGQALFFMAFHYVCAWRRGDMIHFQAPQIDDLDVRIEQLRIGCFEKEIYRQIWLGVEKAWYVGRVSRKTSQELIIRTPIDFLEFLGMYLCVAEYHRIKHGYKTILQVKEIDKLWNYENLFGKEIYHSIFGNKVFRNRRLNKQFLMTYAKGVCKEYAVSIHTLPELVAAYLRGHKFDFKEGQNTILRYISHMSDGMTVDEVSYHLFRTGTMGHYKAGVAQILMEGYSNLKLQEQVDVLEVLDISPVNIEMQLETISNVNGMVTELGYVNNYCQLAKRIVQAYERKPNNANEENVFCLFEGMVGHRNPDCIGSNNCLKCSGSKENSLLCEYGIFSWQYIYNLMFQITFYSEMNAFLLEQQKQYAHFETAYIAIQNTLDKNISVMEYLDNIIFEFIESVEVSDTLRKELIHLYEGGM